MKASSRVLHHVHFPGESAEYRAARNALLAEEMELRRQIERVSAQRRGLPTGGMIPEDYQFDGNGGTVKLSALFEPGKDTLAIYSFMYGPERDGRARDVRTFSMGSTARRSISFSGSTWRLSRSRPCRASLPSRKNAAGGDCACCPRPATATTAPTSATYRVCRLPYGSNKNSKMAWNGTCRCSTCSAATAEQSVISGVRKSSTCRPSPARSTATTMPLTRSGICSTSPPKDAATFIRG